MTSSPPNSAVWVVIPVHNNAGTIRDVALGCRGIVGNVLIVDDGSRDADLRELMSGTGIPVIRHETNCGKGAALLTGAREVAKRGGTTMIAIDGDGQHDPEDLPAFLQTIQEDPDAIIIGERDMSGANVPGRSRFGRRFSDFWLRLETGLPLRDTQSGFRAYPVRHLLALPASGRKFDFEVEILALAAWAGLTIRNVPIRVWYPPPHERVTSFRPFLDNLLLTHRHVLIVLRRVLPLPHRKLVAGTADPARRKRGNALGFWFFTTAVRLTGLRGAYGLLFFVSAWYVVFDSSIVLAALAYLRRRFPADGLLRQRWNVYQLFIAQGRCLIDRYYLVHGGDRLRFHQSGFEKVAPLLAGERGFILLTAHVGNWQSAMISLEGWNKTVHLLIRPDDDDLSTKKFGLYRESGRIRTINPAGYLGGVIGVMAALDAGEIVSVMGDRDYNTRRKSAAEFFGAPAEFPCSGFLFAHAARVPLAVLFSAKTGTYEYEVRIAGIIEPLAGEPKAAFLRRGVQEYAAFLEEHLRRYPLQSFLFKDVWTGAASPISVPQTIDPR
ncbi:MAG: glycosyltransferase [Verrucomicrobiae bacterium]